MTTLRSKILILMLSIATINPAAALPAWYSCFFAKKAQQAPKTLSLGMIKIIGPFDGNMAGNVFKKILQFQGDPEIKGVLLVIESTGGNMGELIFREVAALNSVKPVVVLVLDRCHSAVYQVAIGAQWIIAPAEATIGSIGFYFNIEKNTNIKYQDKEYSGDAAFEVIYAGKYKVMRHRYTAPLSEEERMLLQEYANEQYKLFYTMVAQQRKLSLANLDEWAEGRVFTGEKALKLGLIDQVGGFSDAVKKLTELIKERQGSAEGKVVFVE